MRVKVERKPGRWYSLPWTATLYGDSSMWAGMGVGFTRAGAIRAAFTDAANKIISPTKPRPDPVHHEELSA